MADRRTLAIILGTTVGIAAATAVIGFYATRDRETVPKDVNEIFREAKRTVEKIGRAVEALRRSEA